MVFDYYSSIFMILMLMMIFIICAAAAADIYFCSSFISLHFIFIIYPTLRLRNAVAQKLLNLFYLISNNSALPSLSYSYRYSHFPKPLPTARAHCNLFAVAVIINALWNNFFQQCWFIIFTLSVCIGSRMGKIVK